MNNEVSLNLSMQISVLDLDDNDRASHLDICFDLAWEFIHLKSKLENNEDKLSHCANFWKELQKR